MAFQTPITIMKTLGFIERSEYVLPAIQREFVWEHSKIERLFDSLMRGYPIGSFLVWKIGRDSIEKYKFYDFMLHYHQRDHMRLTALGEVTRDEITAVLDGQQRLTALNIGLRGSYAYKRPRRWWKQPGRLSQTAFVPQHPLRRGGERGGHAVRLPVPDRYGCEGRTRRNALLVSRSRHPQGRGRRRPQ